MAGRAAVAGGVAFDHREILDYAVRRLQSKLGYSSLGFELLAEEFTLPELQHVYEAVLGVALNRGNFRRKVLEAGVVEDTGRRGRRAVSQRICTGFGGGPSGSSRRPTGLSRDKEVEDVRDRVLQSATYGVRTRRWLEDG